MTPGTASTLLWAIGIVGVVSIGVVLLVFVQRSRPELQHTAGALLGVDHEGYGTDPGTWKGEPTHLQVSTHALVGESLEAFVPTATHGWVVEDTGPGTHRRGRAPTFAGRFRVSRGAEPNRDIQRALMAVPHHMCAVEVDAAGIHLHLHPKWRRTEADVRHHLDVLLAVVEAFRRVEADHSAQALDDDAEVSFRVEALERLHREDPEAASTVCGKLLSDVVVPPPLALRAAVFQGDVRRAIDLFVSKELVDEQRLDAIRALADQQPDATVAALRGLPVHSERWLACVQAVRDPSVASLLPLVEGALGTPEVSLALAGRFASAAPSERVLQGLRQLVVVADVDTAKGAAAGLAEHGTLDDVPALRARERGAGLELGLATALADAVQAIQDRSGGEAGALSMPEARGGELAAAPVRGADALQSREPSGRDS